MCDGGAVRETVSEATESGLHAGPGSHGTALPSPVPADLEAATDVSLASGPMARSSVVASPSCAEGTAAGDSALLTSLPARPSAEDSPAEKASVGPSADDPPNADGNKSALVDNRPAYQPPSGTHSAQPEDGGAVRSITGEQTRVPLPRAVAWEVPAGKPSPAVLHAAQPPRQTSGERDRSLGVSHAPPGQVSASQPAAEAAHAPPAQRNAATSPVRDVLLPHDYADR